MSGLMILEIICLCGKKISESIRDSKIYLCQKSGRGQWPKDIKRLQEGWWVTMENPVYGKIIWLGLKFRLNRRVDRSEWFKIPLLIFFTLLQYTMFQNYTSSLFFFCMEGCWQFPQCTQSQETFPSSVQNPEICGDCNFRTWKKI